MGAKIQALSYYLPQRVVTNDDLAARFEEWTADEITHQTGIVQRHYSAPNEIASDCAVQAAERLFDEHHIDRQSIDFLIFCSQGTDYDSPTTACLIQHRLGLRTNIGAIDISLGCSGFVYSLSVAKGMIEAVGIKNVLLLTGETLSKSLHPDDKATLALFGDAGAATLISATPAPADTPCIGQFVFGTDGGGMDMMIKRNGRLRNPFTSVWGIDYLTEFDQIANDNFFQMNGIGVFSFSMRTAPALVKETLSKHGYTYDDIDLFVFHQANGFMLDVLRRKMRIPTEKFFTYISHCGNTVSSTIPIALAEAIKQGKAPAGSKVLLAAFGVGLSWAATVVVV